MLESRKKAAGVMEMLKNVAAYDAIKMSQRYGVKDVQVADVNLIEAAGCELPFFRGVGDSDYLSAETLFDN